MPELYVGVGSNADPERELRRAVQALEQSFGRVRCSAVYRSRATGVPADDYLNMVVAAASEITAEEVTERLRAIETAHGRTRAQPTLCALDLDLLLYGRCVDAQLRLPRVGVLSAPFVLAPLAELAPRLTHPLTGECFAAAWTTRAPAAAPVTRVGSLRSFG
jgi:2-amino-4-hydroxy-6-hydroxymethyldihydropteridine diphosphokinase